MHYAERLSPSRSHRYSNALVDPGSYGDPRRKSVADLDNSAVTDSEHKPDSSGNPARGQCHAGGNGYFDPDSDSDLRASIADGLWIDDSKWISHSDTNRDKFAHAFVLSNLVCDCRAKCDAFP